MSLTVEQFAEYAADADALWAVVRAPDRLPEWTGAHAEPAGPQWRVDDRVVVTERGRSVWTVVSAEPRVVELVGDTACGQVGIGVRVIAGRGGGATRVVFVARIEASGMRARMRYAPAVRRRFDRWSHGLRRAVDRPT